ncbi:30S ribosomal protein S18 [Candidatus Woesebacteria bacterium RIFCSPLOWO2_01_FULL_39_10]|uniref:Small ribosomal subunit protein bS18 n=1 Tax=Candidatus Woesebacteria bacterium RIFCSPLOWO2_01_FULL_39_10 TaxID=1802516 RepID=A0A1F8B9X6_9BACT|nr:MAG: 30S ribosomal protein S18 [Candidatus Woesebacteria bacterium RIFCSPLOWO2_01_FULL_39_10]
MAEDTQHIRRVTYPCPFCEMEKTPNYKDYKTLSKYISDRAKILGRSRTGVCATHQRALSVSVKRARFLGLLPYTPTSTG